MRNALGTPLSRLTVVAWTLLAIAICTACSGGKPSTEHSETAGKTKSTLSTVSVTQAADELRTGWYPNQPQLSPTVVGGSTFGKLFSTTVAGQVYAQPLLSAGTLFVATEGNNVYGLNPETGVVNWTRNLGNPVSASALGCSDLAPSLGVTSTPVIDTATNIAYVFSKQYVSGTSGAAAWYAHAIDVATGNEEPGFPVLIQGHAANDPTQTFNPWTAQQRPGLLLLDGVVYGAFGAHCDITPWEGWVVGVSTSGQLTTMWSAQAGAAATNGAGIWQSGGGLVSDGSGQILFVTGNGGTPVGMIDGKSPPATLGESVVRLTVQPDGSLKATDFFTPYDGAGLDTWDADFGSCGPAGLPSQYFGTTAHPNLLVTSGKQGYMYLIDRDHLGGIGMGPSGGDAVLARIGPVGGAWSKPAVWPGNGGYVYLPSASGGNSSWGSTGFFRVYQYGLDGTGNPTLSLAASSTDAFGFSSSQPIVTSDGVVSGSALVWIIWAPDTTGSGAQLRAYNAVPSGGAPTLVYSTPIGTSSKFVPPGVGNGRIYIGTRDGQVIGFGSPIAVNLTGTGLSYGNVIVGFSQTQTLTVTATNPLTVTSISSSNPDFAVGTPSATLPATLAAGAKLSIPVTFTPSVAGLRGGAITVNTNLGPTSFTVSGQGQTPNATLTAAPPAVSFGGTTIGGQVAGSVTFANTGGSSLTITSITLPQAPFTVMGAPAPGTVLTSGQAITLTVLFSPTSLGNFADSITIDTSAGSDNVMLSGVCTPPGHLTISPTTLSYGLIGVGATISQSFTLTNDGGSSITFTKSKPPAGGVFIPTTSLPEGTILAPGATLIETVAFEPNQNGLLSDTWALTADDGSGEHIVTFNGSGAPDLTKNATPIASVTNPTGGGNHSLSVMSDGYFPPIDSDDETQQYDTYNGQRQTDAWFGYTFPSTQTCGALLFQEGIEEYDGGWFNSLQVQVLQSGSWVTVSGAVFSPVYPGQDGINYETYQITFPPISCDGIRIDGPPGGANTFASVAELRAFGTSGGGGTTNSPPTANAGAPQSVMAGATVTLDGSGSSDPNGDAITYAWSAPSGIVLSSTTAQKPTFVAPSVTTVTQYTFTLVVNDGSLSSAPATVTISVNPPSAGGVDVTSTGTIIAKITAPTGGGNKNIAIIRDGDMPPVNTQDSSRQYDTYTGDQSRTEDYFGYTFATAQNFTKLVFQEGMEFWDGGWFSSIQVQVLQGTTWVTVPGATASPAYPGQDGITYETFTFNFPAISGTGIRIDGVPGGADKFTSCAELRVFTDGSTPTNSPPVASAGANQSVTSGTTVTLDGSGSSDPNGDTITYAWTQTAGPSVTLSSPTAQKPTFTAPTVTSATALTFSLVVNDGKASSAASTTTVTVNPAVTNLPPTANAGANQTVSSGAAVTLDGSGSSDPNGDKITYAWTQTGGPAVALSSTTAQKPTFTAPTVSATTTLTFSLVVNDGSLSSSASTVTITVNPAGPNSDITAAATIVAKITAPTGGGNKSLEVIRDGDVPPPGTNSNTRQYDTYNGQTRTEDWIGYTFSTAQTFTKLVFTEGMQFGDGGWFTSIKVQVLQSGTWTNVTGATVSPAYAGANGVSYDTYTFTIPSVTGTGIRIDGVPGGSATFISCGELRAFGGPSSGNHPPVANAGTAQTVAANAAVTLDGSGSSDPDGDTITYAWSQTAGPVVTLSSTTAQKPTFTAPSVSAATTLTFSLTVNDGALSSAASTVNVTVNPVANQPPVANAGSAQTVASGTAVVTLDGSASKDPEGASLTYAWSQTGGPPVSLSSTTVVKPTFAAPTVSVSTALTFSLVVSDGVNQSAASTVTITVTPGGTDITSLGTAITKVTAPTGGGNKSLNVIHDGDMPPQNTQDSSRQYDTYNGAKQTEGYFGYTFTASQSFTKVVFQEGMQFYNGGWFTSIKVQVLQGSTWVDVPSTTVTPAYAGANNVTYDTYTFTFPAVTGTGIRVDGVPGGSSTFVSCGELRVFQ
ncbi:MAG TPA: PKD domain-containing protein [Polyangiaceae bacterium]|nr:PKD domain-containing protein [Polyangiaceae bacterium]